MRTTLRVRRGTAATWAAADPILEFAEPGLETDTNKLKFGDGVTRWSLLPYFAGGGGPGPAGPAGKDGSTMPLRDGKPGAWGFPGPKGDTGPAGAPGAPGGVGATGATGQTGMPGFDGRAGPWGMPGPKGDQGIQGIQGIQGNTGATGASGRDIPGRDGRPGPWGFPGPAGDRGLQGVQGNAGAAGAQGSSGPPGMDGRPGASGLLPVMQLVTARDCGSGNTADVVANAVDTYLTGSMVDLTRALKAGSVIRWIFRMTKSAAGIAAATFTVRGGINGTTADAALVALALVAAQTAVVDDGWCEITAILRSVGTAAVLSASGFFTHTLATTGLSTSQNKTASGNSAGFDSTVKPLRIGVSCNPGSAGVWTFQSVSVVANNLQPAF